MATARTAKNAAANMQLPPEVLEGIYLTMRRSHPATGRKSLYVNPLHTPEIIRLKRAIGKAGE